MAQPILPEPPEQLKRLSETLSERIRSLIRNEGMIPFSRFMDMALYEPGLGYYSAGLHKLGAGGDFVTAPEIGGIFAACVARQAAELGTAVGAYDILEVGAGTGSLASRLLDLLGRQTPPERYLILETSADLRRVQGERISAEAPEWVDRVGWLDAPPEEGWSGLLLANEVIDALAVERFRLAADGVEQVCVTETETGFAWSYRPAPADLRAAVDHITGSLAQVLTADYRSEVHLTLADWLRETTARLQRGLALFIDYGYPRHEFYLPERRDGTLMCHYRHRAHGDVFFWPGLQDITAWVDFTALAEAADACGLDVLGYCSQAMFLLGCGLSEVMNEAVAADPDAAVSLAAEARQLTLPGLMGERFQVMGLGRGLDDDFLPLSGFNLQDLRYRL